jgi:hypothetical protein
MSSVLSKLVSRSTRHLASTFSTPSFDFSRFSHDPRSRRGRRWDFNPLMFAVFFGLLANRGSLRGAEDLTEWGGPLMRRFVKGRVPDSTLYDLVSKLGPEGLREQLHAQVYDLWRAKSLEPVGLPCSVVAIDGKTALSGPGHQGPDPAVCQVSHPKDRPASWQLRVVRSCLISAAGNPAIDQVAIPASTNEMGIFPEVFASLEAAYGARLEVYSMDSGYCSLGNASLVHTRLKGYIFVLKQNQPELLREAERVLGHEQVPERSSEWEAYKGGQVRYHLWRSTQMAGYLEWKHLEQVWRVDREVRKGGQRSVETRYFVTNVHRGRFTPQQTLEVVRRHWMIENGCNWTLDVIWDEDTKAWCTKGQAIEVLGLLRLMAYNVVARLRCRYLKGKAKRAWRWWTNLAERVLTSVRTERDEEEAPGI